MGRRIPNGRPLTSLGGAAGSKVHAVTSGTQTLKDASTKLCREWTQRIEDTLNVMGSLMGPHHPYIVRDFQSVIAGSPPSASGEGRKLPTRGACEGGGSKRDGAVL